MKIRIPEFLHTGGTIGITAPSFGCTIEPYVSKFNTAKKILEARGYNIKAGPTVAMSDGKGISTDPKTCAKELQAFLQDKSVNAIISAGGGEMMCETVEHMDFDKLSRCTPKWFMGYSDNTNFIFPMVTIAHTAGIYGPCISGFGKKWEQSEEDAIALLTGTKDTVSGYEKFQRPQEDISPDDGFENYTYCLKAPKILSSFTPSSGGLVKAKPDQEIPLEGILLGGCLDVLANLCGTKLDRMKQFNEEIGSNWIVWVLESCDANPMEMRRQIWHLKNAGWFDKAAGFLCGRPLASFEQEMMGVDQYNAATDILGDLDVPVVMDCDIGHVDPAMPLIMGVHSKVKVKGNSIMVKFELK